MSSLPYLRRPVRGFPCTGCTETLSNRRPHNYFKCQYRFAPPTNSFCDKLDGHSAPSFCVLPAVGPPALELLSGKSEMVAANRVAALNPPIDDTDPIWKFSIDPGSHTHWQNPAEFSPKEKPIRNFSIEHTSSIRTRLRTPFLRTPFPRLLC